MFCCRCACHTVVENRTWLVWYQVYSYSSISQLQEVVATLSRQKLLATYNKDIIESSTIDMTTAHFQLSVLQTGTVVLGLQLLLWDLSTKLRSFILVSTSMVLWHARWTFGRFSRTTKLNFGHKWFWISNVSFFVSMITPQNWKIDFLIDKWNPNLCNLYITWVNISCTAVADGPAKKISSTCAHLTPFKGAMTVLRKPCKIAVEQNKSHG